MPSPTFYTRWGKRALDLLLAGSALLALTPLVAVLAAIGIAAHGRPVFFSQQRIGRFGQPFTVWKFRTMTSGRQPDSTITTTDDARVTRWGWLLRRSKLDEIPQLWCVLRGTMSLVGPRPDVPGYWDRLSEADQYLLALRPGLTGPMILIFRPEEALFAGLDDPIEFNDRVLFPEKVRLTSRYAAEQTLCGDLKWILYTVLPSRFVRWRLEATGWNSVARRP